MTDKFSLDSYIFIEKRPINSNNIIIGKDYKTMVDNALNIGRTISIIFHEINHHIYSYLLYFYNGVNYFFETPRESKLGELKEGAFYMEIILFGRIIEN